jgi:hypothetical protein
MLARHFASTYGWIVSVLRVALALSLLSFDAPRARAQAPAAAAPAVPGAAAAAAPIRVALSCASCDLALLKATLQFVEFVDHAAAPDVDVQVTSTSAAGEVRTTLALTGHGRFDGLGRTISYHLAASAPAAWARADLARFLMLGLAEYVAATPAGDFADLRFTRAPAAAAPAAPQRDRWNYWVFRSSVNLFAYGEQSTSSRHYNLSGSANRTTEQWKLRLGGSRSINTSSFDVGPTLTVTSRTTNWGVDGLAVKSLDGHWGAALTGSATGSSFSNSRLVARLTPGVEFDIFPYAESSRRSLTFQYTLGGAYYDYAAETVFGKLREATVQQAATVSLGLKQPWGQAGGSVAFTQHLTALDRTRTTLFGNVSVRLARSLTLNASGSFARIRDQFTLPKGNATDQEVLLRLRQLATGHRYSLSMGFGYSFGALSNVTVNPRFGG